MSCEYHSPLLKYPEVSGEGFKLRSSLLIRCLHSCYFLLLTLSCSQTPPSVCSSCTVTNGVCSTKGVFLAGDVVIFVVERHSAIFAEFWKLDTVELVRCNDVYGVIKGKTNRWLDTSELLPIRFQKIIKLSWWWCNSLSSLLGSSFLFTIALWKKQVLFHSNERNAPTVAVCYRRFVTNYPSHLQG
jgi:hypothetical protein